MRKIIKMVLAFMISGMFITGVKAEGTCSNSEQAELNKLVTKIKATYEAKEEDMDPSQYGHPDSAGAEDEEEFEPPKVSYFDVIITNLDEKLYLVVTNDFNTDRLTLSSSDAKDGVITFQWRNLTQVTNFDIEVYSNNNTGCANELQKTIKVKLPRENEFYYSMFCTNNPDFNLCEKFVTYAPISTETFLERTEKYTAQVIAEEEEKAEEANKTWLEKVKDFVVANKYYFIGGGAVVLIGAGVVVAVIVKKRRSSEL